MSQRVGPTGVAEAIVQPVGAALPHLERLVREAIAAPVRRARHLDAAVALLDLGDGFVERGTIDEHLALLRRPRADLALTGTGREVGV